MIVIPTGTDAPIYHWPRMTVALIALNVAAFVALPPRETEHHFDANDNLVEVVVSNFDRYALTLGDGLHPLQWLTHNFLHLGWLHLAGNMLFLWSFGIVVEGKLGALKYLATYLSIGTLHGALMQSLLLHRAHVGNAAGASAVIYGLLAICMIWAPRNELNCVVIFIVVFRVLVFHWDLYYTTVALIYIGGQVFWLALYGFSGVIGFAGIGVSELGHVSGAFWGTVLAIGLLKSGWVDCEGWDLFALAAKRRQLARDWKKRGEALERNDASIKKAARGVARAKPDADPNERAAPAVRRVLKLIEQGDIDGSLKAYDKAARSLVAWPSQTDLYAFIKAMHAQRAAVNSIRLMRDHCRYYPAESNKVRLLLAQVLLRECQRPAAALRALDPIPPRALPPELETARQKFAKLAVRMQQEGVLEVEGDD